ncbi:MAG: hypothetical protein ACR2PO_03330 [Methyloligellaceae bacterium]
MTHSTRTHQYRWIGVIALALVTAFAATPRVAHAGGLDRAASPSGPRWSNDHHVPGVSLANDCRNRADYAAGRDVWGRPVAPADLPGASPNTPPLTLDIEVEVPRRQAANGQGQQVTAHVLIDPSAKGRGRPQDCIPSVK